VPTLLLLQLPLPPLLLLLLLLLLSWLSPSYQYCSLYCCVEAGAPSISNFFLVGIGAKEVPPTQARNATCLIADFRHGSLASR